MNNVFKDKKYIFFVGTYVSICAFILCSAVGLGFGKFLSKLLAVLMFGLYLFCSSKAKTADFEKVVLVLSAALFSMMMLIRGKMQGSYWTFHILLCVMLLIFGIVYISRSHSGVSIRRWLVQNKIILLIMLAFALLSVEVVDAWMMWDSRIYSTSIRGIAKNFDADFSNVYALYLASHASLGYSLWCIPFQLLCEGIESVQIADISLAAVSIYAYYQILRNLLGNKYSNNILALAAAPYAFSPFVLGLVGNVNLDSASMYFAVIFIACSMFRYECLELVFAACFCFTKEPAVIYYTVYILAKVICEYLQKNSFSLWGLLKCGFGNIKNYIYALPVVLWGLLYLFHPSGGWMGSGSSIVEQLDSIPETVTVSETAVIPETTAISETMKGILRNKGMNHFGFSMASIVMRLKQIFFLNFNWIFWLTLIIAAVGGFFYARKFKPQRETVLKVLPICAMGMAVPAFFAIYNTHTMPRYILPVFPVIYIVGTLAASYLGKKFFGIWNILTSFLLLVQCFHVIDPVMVRVFDSASISVGDSKLYGMQYTMEVDGRKFDEHIAYNRQYLYWPATLLDALQEAEYDGSMLIVLPDDPISTGPELFGQGSALWNVQTGGVDYFDEVGIPEHCVVMDIANVRDVDRTRTGISAGNRILYLIPHWSDIDMGFVLDELIPKQIVKQGEVKHRGYSVQYIVMRIEENMQQFGEGHYKVSPKKDSSLSLYTNGEELILEKGANALSVSEINNKYRFIFDEYQTALDVPNERVDDNGTVGVWQVNDSDAQKWVLRKVEGYYMICFRGYALTYDLADNSLKLAVATCDENQLWRFD